MRRRQEGAEKEGKKCEWGVGVGVQPSPPTSCGPVAGPLETSPSSEQRLCSTVNVCRVRTHVVRT